MYTRSYGRKIKTGKSLGNTHYGESKFKEDKRYINKREIELCLNCQKKKCNNCLEKGEKKK